MGGSCWGKQGVPLSLWPWDREADSLCCPVRPMEVTGASSPATGKPDGCVDFLWPLLLSLWTDEVSDERTVMMGGGSHGLVCRKPSASRA